MHNYVNPLQIRKGDVLKVPVGRLQMYFRVVLVERDLCSNTFLRCFRVPPDADAIPANPYYALLWKDCSELVCLYQDYLPWVLDDGRADASVQWTLRPAWHFQEHGPSILRVRAVHENGWRRPRVRSRRNYLPQRNALRDACTLLRASRGSFGINGGTHEIQTGRCGCVEGEADVAVLEEAGFRAVLVPTAERAVR